MDSRIVSVHFFMAFVTPIFSEAMATPFPAYSATFPITFAGFWSSFQMVSEVLHTAYRVEETASFVTVCAQIFPERMIASFPIFFNPTPASPAHVVMSPRSATDLPVLYGSHENSSITDFPSDSAIFLQPSKLVI